MAEDKSDGGGSWLGNPNALLALITVVGGLWLVSHELTSDRPVSPAGAAEAFIGDQRMEARLWEDPFKPDESANSPGGRKVTIELDELVSQIKRKRPMRNAAPGSEADAADVLLLPVMISGGQYSEDQESRIRSRYAIVSALGRFDYVPDDAEHLGAVPIPWLTNPDIERALRPGSAGKAPWEALRKANRLVGPPAGAESKPDSPQLNLRYEWYRPRDFASRRTKATPHAAVLVLWLDDSYFEDYPLLRLALLLDGLSRPDSSTSVPPVALIGPRRSQTLRAMLPKWTKAHMPAGTTPALENSIKDVLGRITLYSATASAMDEVLADDIPAESPPRARIGGLLREAGFQEFRNFSATDAQMAEELLDELALRDADPGNPRNHLVLISEWDTFYGRILSLTYGAELARHQDDQRRARDPAAAGPKLTRAGYVKQFTASGTAPENLHSFVYLRGLDGQTVGGTGGENGGKGGGGDRAVTLEELPRWKPDANKAEGQAQFDYLGRLGDRVAELQATLRSGDEGEIKAIGIVGSDVYDTLLILQALRRRFTDVLFFTTDLDVRFFHPHERAWARNLIVVSAYGLALDPTLQDPIAPFRDSTQTAQFAAVLAALGNQDLRKLELIPPRRFEVGNSTAVDLSVTRPAGGTGSGFRLHPPTASEAYRAQSGNAQPWPVWGIIALLLLAGGLIVVCEWLRRQSWHSLAFTEEDIGGPDGAHALLRGLAGLPDDKLAVWLLEIPRVRKLGEKLKKLSEKKPPEEKPSDEKPPGEKLSTVNWEREDRLAELLSVFVGQFNRLLIPGNLTDDPKMVAIAARAADKELNPEARARLDKLLDDAARVSRSADPAVGSAAANDDARKAEIKKARREADLEAAACAAAHTARESADALFRLQRWRWKCFWSCAAVFGLLLVGLIYAIRFDTFRHDTGELFSLTSGTSAWPASIVRLIVFALAVWFSFTLRHRNQEAFLVLTRMFRFSAPAEGKEEDPDKSDSRVCAEAAWAQYRRKSELRHRWYFVGVEVLLYFLALFAIWKVSGGQISNPTRGDLVKWVNVSLLMGSVIGFMLVGFLAVDKAVLCREFIKELGAAPTRYPITTCRHFARQKGRINDEYLDEWIDLQLIAELTERVGRTIYYPTILVLLMVMARNSWWDSWTWPVPLLVVFVFNFGLALASLIILQRAAKSAKNGAEQSLKEKVRKLKARNERSAAANDAAREEELLEEVQTLNRGAFVPFWENPVVGAIFLSSGGTTALQLFIWFMAR